LGNYLPEAVLSHFGFSCNDSLVESKVYATCLCVTSCNLRQIAKPFTKAGSYSSSRNPPPFMPPKVSSQPSICSYLESYESPFLISWTCLIIFPFMPPLSKFYLSFGLFFQCVEYFGLKLKLQFDFRCRLISHSVYTRCCATKSPPCGIRSASGLDRRIILKWISRKWDVGHGLDRADSG
jgi:hypothetical protein